MGSHKEGSDILSMFGLTESQTRILFSIEKILVEMDIETTKKHKEEKEKWLSEWTISVSNSLSKMNPKEPSSFFTLTEIQDWIVLEDLMNNSNTWYYLIMLEATLFNPYYQLDEVEKSSWWFNKLKYSDQTETLKYLVSSSGIMDPVFIDRFKKTYSKSIAKLSGRFNKIAMNVLIFITITAIGVALAGTYSRKIAVKLFGQNFSGLVGNALVNACLAFAGGGAVSVGGKGIAGGIKFIVGGGALLGMSVGGTVVGVSTLFVTSIPQFTLTEAARLEVVLKEIIINAQKDVKFAQNILDNLSNQIVNLKTRLTKFELEQEEDKRTISDLEKSIEYMEKAYKESRKFVSSYEIGTE